MMDEASGYCWSEFIKHKSELSEIVIRKIIDLREKGIAEIKIIRCDNAGENKVLMEKCKQKGLRINFEFTARNTPKWKN